VPVAGREEHERNVQGEDVGEREAPEEPVAPEIIFVVVATGRRRRWRGGGHTWISLSRDLFRDLSLASSSSHSIGFCSILKKKARLSVATTFFSILKKKARLSVATTFFSILKKKARLSVATTFFSILKKKLDSRLRRLFFRS
jgi:hypothetical protein